MKKLRKIKRIFWLLLGGTSMGMGAVGVVLPILPTVPLLLLALFCFARSSAKVENWFRSTKLHKQHLEPFMEKKVMTKRAKITVMASMTVVYGSWFLVYGQRTCRQSDSGGCMAVSYDLFYKRCGNRPGTGGIKDD